MFFFFEPVERITHETFLNKCHKEAVSFCGVFKQVGTEETALVTQNSFDKNRRMSSINFQKSSYFFFSLNVGTRWLASI